MRRLNKQIAECGQIAAALKPEAKGWRNHPAVLMWRGYETALCTYRNLALEEWIRRGYNSTRQPFEITGELVLPHWIGGMVHVTHRSNLLRKDPIWYGQFGWTEPADLEYYWPRRSIGGECVDIPEPKLEDFV